MMGTRMIQQLRDALVKLNPGEVQRLAERPLRIELFAGSEDVYRAMEAIFQPAGPAQHNVTVYRWDGRPVEPDLRVVQEGGPQFSNSVFFDVNHPHDLIREIVEQRDDLRLALARYFPAFREAVTTQIIRQIARENAIFALATAVPYIVPFLSLPWAVGEFASDTAFLTMNQVRMAFQLAAAFGRPVGYRQQKREIASIIAAAFGWRALARELVGKIPAGGGLIPKAAVAYAATYVVGLSLERVYRLGAELSRSEKKAAYAEAFELGKALAGRLLEERAKQAQA